MALSWRGAVLGATLVVLIGSSRGQAQGFAPKADKPDVKLVIPKGYAPPAGMCRIWIENVTPAQQPAPTDCATAIKNRPANGRVVFGDDDGERRRAVESPKKAEIKGKIRKP